MIFPSPFREYLPSVEELLKKRNQVWLHFTLILLLILSNWLFNRRICEFTSKCIIFKKWRKWSVDLIGLQYIEKLSELILTINQFLRAMVVFCCSLQILWLSIQIIECPTARTLVKNVTLRKILLSLVFSFRMASFRMFSTASLCKMLISYW